MQEIVFVDSQEGLLSSRGGGGGGQTYWHQAYNTNATAALALSWLRAKMSECRLCDVNRMSSIQSNNFTDKITLTF